MTTPNLTAGDGTPEPTPSPSDGASPEVDSADKRLKREAQQLRQRLRDAEAERDTLRSHVDGYQRAEIERAATGPGALHDGADLIRDRELGEFLGEDGTVNTDAVAEAVAQLRDERPHLGQPESFKTGKPHESLRPSPSGGGDPTDDGPPASWHSVLSG